MRFAPGAASQSAAASLGLAIPALKRRASFRTSLRDLQFVGVGTLYGVDTNGTRAFHE